MELWFAYDPPPLLTDTCALVHVAFQALVFGIVDRVTLPGGKWLRTFPIRLEVAASTSSSVVPSQLGFRAASEHHRQSATAIAGSGARGEPENAPR